MEPIKREGGGWRTSIFIIWVEVAERFAYFGIAGNLISYLTKEMRESVVVAARNVNMWSGVSTILPLFGAFVADAYLGRFLTIIFSSFIYILGLGALTFSVALRHTRLKEPLFFVALYLVAIGEGGHKPCVQAFGADQFSEESEQEKRARNSFFNWWYLGICGGASTAMVVVYYLQDNVGWTIGYGVITIIMSSALALFLSGWRLYRRQAPSGSELTRVAQVLVAASRKAHLPSTMDNHIHLEGQDDQYVKFQMDADAGRRPLSRTKQFRCLDKASIVDEIDVSNKYENRWRLCTTTQVEEVKMLIRVIPIWVTCLMYAVVFAQLSTFFTKQNSTLNRKIGSFVIPSASLQVVAGITSVVTVPIYDRVIVPLARRITRTPSGITMLQRIGFGLFLCIVIMVVAALVERKRLQTARELGLVDAQNVTSVPMSVVWMLPQYIVFGVADVFAVVGLQEFFYEQVPDGLRSVGAAAYLCIFGVGSFLSGGIISIIEEIRPEWVVSNLNQAHLDYFYWLLAALSALWLGLFLVVSKRFLYKQIEGVNA